MKVSEIMNKAFVVDEGISVKEAAKLMSSKGIGSLIVMNKDKMVGIVTEKDVTKNVSRLGEKVGGIMSQNLITIGKNESIDDAAELMRKHKIKRLPVVSKGELVGIVTATDLIENSDELNEEFFLG